LILSQKIISLSILQSLMFFNLKCFYGILYAEQHI
jgi:hypothetical protein